MKEKILMESEIICLFCGNPQKKHWEDGESYYECDCIDAALTRNIQIRIDELKDKFPKPKYQITRELVLRSISDNT